MTTSNFDLYKSEWLDLVFAKRNKEYGAYYLRQQYAGNMTKAMAITFITVITIFVTAGYLIRVKPREVFKSVEVPLTAVNPVQPEKPKTEAVHHAKSPAPKPQVTVIKFLTPVVTSQPVHEEPKRIDEMQGEIGDVNIDIPGDGKAVVDDGSKSGKGDGPASVGTDLYLPGGVDINPEPFGGAAAWTKFLQKNLRYPGEAQDKGIGGRVYVSFIVERDGRLSSFVIERGAGYGMDEESLRVLKKAPAWKPGRQNGQAVRVKYTLPLNFVLNTENN